MLLARDPRVIPLDEPMAFVSMEQVPGLPRAIKTAQAEEGKPGPMVDAPLHVVTDVADRSGGCTTARFSLSTRRRR